MNRAAIYIAARLVREAPQDVEGRYMSRADRQRLGELMRTAARIMRELHDSLKAIADMEGNYATIDEALRIAHERYLEVTGLDPDKTSEAE